MAKNTTTNTALESTINAIVTETGIDPMDIKTVFIKNGGVCYYPAEVDGKLTLAHKSFTHEAVQLARAQAKEARVKAKAERDAAKALKHAQEMAAKAQKRAADAQAKAEALVQPTVVATNDTTVTA